jgi:transcriptional regulator GlxA family with amidase domain
MNFGIIVFPDVEELDFVGPWEMLTMWSKLAAGPENCLIVAEKREPVVCAKGLSSIRTCLLPTARRWTTCSCPAAWARAARSTTPRWCSSWPHRRRAARRCCRCAPAPSCCMRRACSSGKTATTHWGSLDRLRALGDVKVVEQRFVQDGDVWTSAGVSAGTDLMLAFIAHTAGEEAAAKVQLQAEYYPADTVYGSTASHERAPAYVRQPGGKLRKTHERCPFFPRAARRARRPHRAPRCASGGRRWRSPSRRPAGWCRPPCSRFRARRPSSSAARSSIRGAPARHCWG